MSKILVVDDDESILDAISLILEEVGYTVKTSFKGEKTYAMVESFHPDLILLDVLMSGKDGRHICRNLKQNDLTKLIPVIMISAHPSAQQGALECGAEDFLAKPFEVEELLSKVTSHLKKNKKLSK